MKYRVARESQRESLIEDIRSAELPFRAEINRGEDRSLEQNRLSWKWYGELGQHYGLDPEEAHRLCKLRYGTPILMRDSEEFAETFARIIAPLPHEDQMRAMGMLDTTRIMTVKQMTEYLDTLYRDQSKRGVALTDPGEPAVMRGVA